MRAARVTGERVSDKGVPSLPPLAHEPHRASVREACRPRPCSESEHARESAGATHCLRDGAEADADEREEAAIGPGDRQEAPVISES